jgi:hypothetical protein
MAVTGRQSSLLGVEESLNYQILGELAFKVHFQPFALRQLF